MQTNFFFKNRCSKRVQIRIDPTRLKKYDESPEPMHIVLDPMHTYGTVIHLHNILAAYFFKATLLNTQKHVQHSVDNVAMTSFYYYFIPEDGELTELDPELFNKYNISTNKNSRVFIVPMGYQDSDYEEEHEHRREHPYMHKYAHDKAKVGYWSRLAGKYDETTEEWPGWVTMLVSLIFFLFCILVAVFVVIGMLACTGAIVSRINRR